MSFMFRPFLRQTSLWGQRSCSPLSSFFSTMTRSGHFSSFVSHSTGPVQSQLFPLTMSLRFQHSLTDIRNIGISAHIDSGKTTLTERILFYTGRIKDIHEVKGKDGVGAKMDSMELEREKGITIQSAATHCKWKDKHINIIDTPGHVDFTIEVERALRVLDGAILVICGVGGVQSQTFTVDRQMKRYNVPRIVFINKLDRAGASPWKAVEQLRKKLQLPVAAVQVPIGLESMHEGVVDIIENKAYFFDGTKGSDVVASEVPDSLKEIVKQKRQELVEKLAEIDDKIGEALIMEEREPTVQEIKEAIRKQTIARKFVPLFMGSAYKNKGVQLLLDGVSDYLPNPTEVPNYALDISNNEAKVDLQADSKKPLVCLAFKLEEGRFGQLTYTRVYQGTLTRGQTIFNTSTGKKLKVPRIVRMHADEMEEVDNVGAGEICAMFGVDCNSGDTFTEGTSLTMQSMFVPAPVISLAIAPSAKKHDASFSKALSKFQKEDPTFRVTKDPESGETIISGMGELHLFIYTERMKREYGVEVTTGKPQVAFRETINSKGNFAYTHKKQSGGQGQYAKIIGYLEPLEGKENEFFNATIGGSIPPEYIPSIEKGFQECLSKGPLIGQPIVGVRFVVNDGGWHPVDSSDIAFRICTANAFREGFLNAKAQILEPIMKVEITSPVEFQGVIIAGLNRRKGTISNTENTAETVIILAEVPLNNMFGYSTDLRSSTQGKGEFTMEYLRHDPVSRDLQEELIQAWKKKQQEERK